MAQTVGSNPTENRETTWIPLDLLLLDSENPRFGLCSSERDQQKILDHIVGTFGIDDVLNSLAVNGYFEAEPVVCREIPDSNKFVVVEGNRRLAACLMLKGDQRAATREKHAGRFRKLWKDHGCPNIDPIPAIAFDISKHKKEILPYLGVRHIASAQPWDSYAKAAWVAQIVETGDLNIKDVSQMIGDQHQTVNRLLQGYYLVNQLIDSEYFKPQDSNRRGRGSVVQYPFSWIYTMLGYSEVRKYLGIRGDEARKNMLAEDRFERGGLLLHLMFGNSAHGTSAAINESRQLKALASAFESPEKVRLLQEGKPLSEVEMLTQPIERRLSEGLGLIRNTLRDLIARLSEQEIEQEVATDLVPTAQKNRKMAIDLDRRIKEAAYGEEE